MALQEWRDSRAWRPVSVPALDLQHYEATLAVGGPVELRPPMLPGSPPLVPDNASPAEVRLPHYAYTSRVVQGCNIWPSRLSSVSRHCDLQ